MVLVRAFGEKPLVRRVWAIEGDVIYITDDKQLNLLLNGDNAAMPIGFHKEDVFLYEPKNKVSNEVKWNELKNYSAA